MADRPTLAVYDAHAVEWQRRRPPRDVGRAAAFAERSRGDAGGAGAGGTGGVGDAGAAPSTSWPLVDLGCGAGGQLDALGRPTVGLDASAAMLALARRAAPTTPLVRG